MIDLSKVTLPAKFVTENGYEVEILASTKHHVSGEVVYVGTRCCSGWQDAQMWSGEGRLLGSEGSPLFAEGWNLVPLPDPAREAWNALHPEVRKALRVVDDRGACNSSCTALELLTNLSRSDVERIFSNPDEFPA